MIYQAILNNIYIGDVCVAVCKPNHVIGNVPLARMICEALNMVDTRVDLEAKVERLEGRVNMQSKKIEDMQLEIAEIKARRTDIII